MRLTLDCRWTTVTLLQTRHGAQSMRLAVAQRSFVVRAIEQRYLIYATDNFQRKLASHNRALNAAPQQRAFNLPTFSASEISEPHQTARREKVEVVRDRDVSFNQGFGDMCKLRYGRSSRIGSGVAVETKPQ